MAEASRGKVKLEPGVILGLDVVLCDSDADGSFSWLAWGAGKNKHLYAERRGDVLLVADADDLGGITGRAVWKDTQQGAKRSLVWVRPFGQTTGGVRVACDEKGFFSASVIPLPVCVNVCVNFGPTKPGSRV